ncbi:MAG: hypothetical protein ACRC68_09575 [Clostridium sp.]
MVFVIQVFQIIFYLIAIIFMGTLIFLSIWSFVTFNRMYQSQRIQNFLLDKIYQSISKLTEKSNCGENTNEAIFDVDELINEDELFNNNNLSNSSDINYNSCTNSTTEINDF